METKKYEKGSFGWVREQQKIKAKKAGFDNVDDWSKWRMEGAIKNIHIVKKILEENNVEIKDEYLFNRFWSYVDIKDNKEECWNWTICTDEGGYGRIQLGIDTIRAHRVTYMFTKGIIPEGLSILHLCNNPRCCNPNHLKLGTQSENMQYMVNCDRQAKGEANGGSKLTEDQVREILKLYYEQRKLHSGLKQWQIINPIAKKFEISISQIKNIINGKKWNRVYNVL